MTLTVTWLNARLNKPTPDNKTQRRADGNGFGVRISPKGKITFTFRYRFKGVQSSVDLGAYPLVSLVEARNKSNYYLAEIEKGHDPTDHRFNRGKRFLTFQDYAEAWIRDYKPTKRVMESIVPQFSKYIYPVCGNIIVSKTTTHQWMNFYFQIISNSGLGETSLTNLLPRINQVLNYATKHYELPFNPAAGITNKDFNLESKSRRRFLSESEIIQLLMVLPKAKLRARHKRWVRLLLNTGARGAELIRARVKDFDLDNKLWHVTEENSKMGEAFYRPLSDFSIKLIKEQIEEVKHAEYLFQTKDGKPLENSFRKRIKSRLNKVYKELYPTYKLDWWFHDFRRTFRTNANRWSHNEKINELALGHKQGGIDGTYNLYLYIDEMRELYANWDSYLFSLEQA